MNTFYIDIRNLQIKKEELNNKIGNIPAKSMKSAVV